MTRSSIRFSRLAFAAAAAVASSGFASVLFTENFNTYADNVALDVSGSVKWSRLSGVAGDLKVSNPSSIAGVALVRDASSDDSAGSLSSSVNSGFLYASFTLTGDALDRTGSTAGAESFASFYSSSGSFFGRIVPAVPAGTGSTSFRLGVINAGSGSATATVGGIIGTSDLALGTAYNIVLRYDFTLNQTTLWVNPTLESSPSITATDAVGATPNINRFALRQPSADTMGDFSLDNLVVATTFAEVVPEPMALAGFAMAGTLLARRRRRA